MRRRRLLVALALLPAATRAAGSLAAPRPMRQLLVDARGELFALSVDGELWQWRATGWRAVGAGLDPAAPLAAGHGRIVGRSRDGGLWVLDAAQRVSQSAGELAPHAGFLVLAAGIVAVARQQDGSGRLIRFDAQGARWQPSAHGTVPVLPDARLVQFDPGGVDDSDGQVAVYAAPDAQRYHHGVLGDEFEATALLLVERHGLETLRRIDLGGNDVFEDIAPRPIAWRGQRALLCVRSGERGARLAVVAAGAPGQLRFDALGEPIGQRGRWLSPVSDGRQLLAVHTPHIGGVLWRYRDDGRGLVGQPWLGGLSNHRIGERDLDVSAWVGRRLVLPTQDRRRLRVLDPQHDAPGFELELPLPVVSLRAWRRGADEGLVALLDDGRVHWMALP